MSVGKELGICSREYTITFSSWSQRIFVETRSGYLGKRSKLSGKDELNKQVSQGLGGLEQ